MQRYEGCTAHTDQISMEHDQISKEHDQIFALENRQQELEANQGF